MLGVADPFSLGVTDPFSLAPTSGARFLGGLVPLEKLEAQAQLHSPLTSNV